MKDIDSKSSKNTMLSSEPDIPNTEENVDHSPKVHDLGDEGNSKGNK